jgi:CRP-like cAMP-binding protein
MRDTKLQSGEILYRAGSSATTLHFVVSGRIELICTGAAPWTFGAGALLGMFDASIPRPHPRTAKAMEPSQILSLAFDDYLDIIEDNFGFAIETLRFGARDQNLISLKLDRSEIFSPAMLGSTAGRSQLQSSEPASAIDRLLVLREAGLFRAAPVQALTSLARLSEVIQWPAGGTIAAPDTAVVALHVVANGEVSVHHPELGELGTFETAGLVGGLEGLGNDTHEYRALAKVATMTVRLDIEDLLDVAEDHFDLCRSMLSFIARERARVMEVLSGQHMDVERMTI